MTGQTIEHLVANQWVERLHADDAEILGFWQRAIESFDDSATPRLSRTGQFKLLYDAARQGVVALNAAHGYPKAAVFSLNRRAHRPRNVLGGPGRGGGDGGQTHRSAPTKSIR